MAIMRLLRTSRGFTLIEAMVVVSVGLIMAIVGYSGFSNMMQREKVRGAANQLAGHLKEAKMLAIEKHASYAITVDAVNNQYTIFRDDSKPPNYTKDSSEPIVHQVDLDKDFPGVVLNVTTIPFRFDSRGMPRISGTFLGSTFTLILTGKSQCTFTISNIGRISGVTCDPP